MMAGPLGSLLAPPSVFPRLTGLPYLLAGYASQPIYDSAKYLIAGSFVELVRRAWTWIVERFKFHFSVSAEFDEGNAAHEWILHFLTEKDVWKQTRSFQVSAKSTQRSWGVDVGPQFDKSNAEYVPSYASPIIFRWNGYWVEVRRDSPESGPGGLGGAGSLPSVFEVFHTSVRGKQRSKQSILITIFTRDVNVLAALVEESRQRYLTVSTQNIVIHSCDGEMYGPRSMWGSVKMKRQRPLDSLVLEDGVMDALLADAREFFAMEGWYAKAGIPYHRGYLLYGPPGTGKTSTIYTLAGQLGLEIYTLSLSSGTINDSFLHQAAASMPKRSILLIEDIDCAFSSREEGDEEKAKLDMLRRGGPRTNVTMSGLLNVIDGVGSEEGKLFFATTNHIDRLDPALLRPGRIDLKFEYKLATTRQARALYHRFFPSSQFSTNPGTPAESDIKVYPMPGLNLDELSAQFAAAIPEGQFSTAELQGYLLGWKMDPVSAASEIGQWIEQEITDKAYRTTQAPKNIKSQLADAANNFPAQFMPVHYSYISD